MAVKDKIDEDSLIDWNVENEVQLFQAMRGHKPVGVNRYFQMACIHEKLSNSLNKEIASQVIWEKLDTMYDMAALHESEIIPFPNDEMEFSLPQTDFGTFLTEKQGSESIDTSPVSSKTSNAPKNEIKPVKSENSNQEIKSKSGKESYPGKGKSSELLSTPKGAKNDTPSVKNPKSESIQSSSSKSSASKTETSTSRSSQVTKPTLKEPMSSSKNIKQESSSSKNSKDNSSPRNAKVESIKKMESSTPKSHKSDSSQSKVQAKEKGSSQKGEKLETNSSSKSKEVSRSSRESSKSRNNNDSSSDDMPLSSVTKSKKPDESSLKRKRPSRHTDTKSSSPNISSKRRRN